MADECLEYFICCPADWRAIARGIPGVEDWRYEIIEGLIVAVSPWDDGAVRFSGEPISSRDNLPYYVLRLAWHDRRPGLN
jgi:hypothetical protein